MQSKLYLLLVILFVFVNCSISAEQKSRKNDATTESKKKVTPQDKEDKRQKSKFEHYENDDDDVDDTYSAFSSYAGNRYVPSDENHRGFSQESQRGLSQESQRGLSQESQRGLSQESQRGLSLESHRGPSEEGYRTRSRWSPSQPSLPSVQQPYEYDSPFGNANDWSRFDLPNNFPGAFPSISHDNYPMGNSGPSCNSLIDPQYPIFSDTCGAVPQARYSLPNSFGHRERWQIAQILNSLVGSSSDPACTRSLRLLLCPVLFPPCPTRHEPLPVLPCQSYCRAVKARCAIPTLDLLPCEVLPYSSDLCPTNQAYGSFIPPGGHPSLNQPPSPMMPMSREGPSSNYQMQRPYPSLQSILSSQGLQSSSLTPASLSAAMSASAQSSGSGNHYNSGPFSADSFNPSFQDFPSRSYMNEYRQGSRYSPLTRSSNEARSTAESRYQNAAARPSAGSSVVKA